MSRIEQLISEIEEYIDSCGNTVLSNSKIMLNKEEMEELLVEPDAYPGTRSRNTRRSSASRRPF